MSRAKQNKLSFAKEAGIVTAVSSCADEICKHRKHIGKCAFRAKQIRNMVLDTFDVLRATNDVLVLEASKIHTAPQQPATVLKMWVVI